MFRLIKLAVYAFIGYALYELYQGMMAQSSGGGRGEGGMFPASRTQDYNAGLSSSGQNLTGGGEGRTEETRDSDGGSTRYSVGRGVTA